MEREKKYRFVFMSSTFGQLIVSWKLGYPLEGVNLANAHFKCLAHCNDDRESKASTSRERAGFNRAYFALPLSHTQLD